MSKIIWFKSSDGYEKNIRQYSKKDTMSAFILFFLFIFSYAILALLFRSFAFIKENIIVVGCLFNIILILFTFFLVKYNQQKLSSLGIVGGNWKKSCIVGIILALILFYNNCGIYLLGGESLIGFKKMISLIIYYLSVSFCEEIVFRGYIGTRIYGLIRNKWLSVIVSGFLFIIMHFPYRMIAYGLSILDLTIGNSAWLIDLFVTHIILTFIYMKTNSLIGAIIPHWISNLAFNLIDRG